MPAAAPARETTVRRTPSPLPTTMHLNLTNACNLNCRICRPEDFHYSATYLGRPVIERLVAEVFDNLTELRLDSSGELLMARDLPYVLGEATRRGIPTKICTNGILLSDTTAEMICRSSVTNVQISLDSPDKETLEWIRTRAKFEKVIGGARKLVEWRARTGSRLRINFHGAVMRMNLEQLPDLVRLAKDIGVDDVSFAYGFIHEHMDPDWAVFWDQDGYRRVMREVRWLCEDSGIGYNAPVDFGQPVAPTKRCDYLFDKTYVNPDGHVAPCCIGPDGFTGDLNHESFEAIWHGATYQAFRETYDSPTPAFDKCAACYIMTGWDPGDYKPHFHPSHWPYVTARLAGDASARKSVNGIPVTLFRREGRAATAVPVTPLPDKANLRILLFGASGGGRLAMERLAAAGLHDRVRAVCDNNPEAHGRAFHHLTVQSLDEVRRDDINYVVIASTVGRQAIADQLERAGFRKRTEFGTLDFLLDNITHAA